MNRKGILLLCLVIALALVSAACGSDTDNGSDAGDEQQNQSTEAQGDAEETESDDTESEESSGESSEVTFAATEFAFEGPDVLPAGRVTLTMDNQGKQMHEVALGELLEGKTMDDVHALLKKGLPKKPPTWFKEVGGTGAAPGKTGTIDAELTPGNYIMLCFVPDKASKKPHVMLGMMKEFTVE
jgi:hypothetical protein